MKVESNSRFPVGKPNQTPLIRAKKLSDLQRINNELSNLNNLKKELTLSEYWEYISKRISNLFSLPLGKETNSNRQVTIEPQNSSTELRHIRQAIENGFLEIQQFKEDLQTFSSQNSAIKTLSENFANEIYKVLNDIKKLIEKCRC